MTGKHNPLATNPLWRMVIWPRYVSIPLKTHISDPNVVLFNNVARLSVFFIAALMILSIIDWSEKLTSSDVKISYNAWMDLSATPTGGTKPAFCDNSEYDYVYDDAWKYENIGCRNYGTDSFVKGPTGDKFKINTMYKNVVYEICDPATNVNSQGVSCGDTQLFQTGTSDYYNTRVEDGLITLQMFTKCNRTNFDSEAPENKFMPYIIHRPDGSVVEPTSAQRVSGMGIKLSVSELMELFQVPGGLGGSSDDVSLPTSTGKPTHRIVGIRLTIKPEVRNSVSHTLFQDGSLFGNYALHLYISWEPNWTRTVMPPAPTKTSGEQQNTDAYGILINIDMSDTTGIRVFSFAKFAATLADLLVLMVAFHLLMRVFLLNFMGLCRSGHKSTKWRHAANMDIETHVDVRRHTQTSMRRRRSKYVITSVEKILLQLGMKLANSAGFEVPGHRDFKFSTEQKKIMFEQIDHDGSGEVTEDDMKATLEKNEIPCDETQMDRLMDVMDLDGSGTVSISEFQNGIGRALMKAHRKSKRLSISASQLLISLHQDETEVVVAEKEKTDDDDDDDDDDDGADDGVFQYGQEYEMNPMGDEVKNENNNSGGDD